MSGQSIYKVFNSCNDLFPEVSSRLKGFKIAALNITSLVKHIDDLRVVMLDSPIDMLAINETRLDSSIPDNEVNISGYSIVRNDRNRSGGGEGGLLCQRYSWIHSSPGFKM